jgi:hypothetical protein
MWVHLGELYKTQRKLSLQFISKNELFIKANIELKLDAPGYAACE